MQFQDPQVADGIGTLIITGISMPYKEYNPLSEIWSGLRKYIKKNTGAKVDIIGTFRYKGDSVECEFYANMAEAERKNVQFSEYQSLFEQVFPEAIALLEMTLERFMFNPDGLQRYESILAENQERNNLPEPYPTCQKEPPLDGLFRSFLTAAGILDKEDNVAAIRKSLAS